MSRVRILRTGAFLVCTTGCSAPGDKGAEPVTIVEKSEAGAATLIAIESDTLVNGRRPQLTLVCEKGKTASFQLDLVSPPPAPPPDRGVFAQVQVKGGPEVTIELGWTGAASWVPRLPHPSRAYSAFDDEDNQRRMLPILHAFSRERILTLRPPAAHGPAQDLVWNPRTLGPHLKAAQECAALPPPLA